MFAQVALNWLQGYLSNVTLKCAVGDRALTVAPLMLVDEGGVAGATGAGPGVRAGPGAGPWTEAGTGAASEVSDGTEAEPSAQQQQQLEQQDSQNQEEEEQEGGKEWEGEEEEQQQQPSRPSGPVSLCLLLSSQPVKRMSDASKRWTELRLAKGVKAKELMKKMGRRGAWPENEHDATATGAGATAGPSGYDADVDEFRSETNSSGAARHASTGAGSDSSSDSGDSSSEDEGEMMCSTSVLLHPTSIGNGFEDLTRNAPEPSLEYDPARYQDTDGEDGI